MKDWYLLWDDYLDYLIERGNLSRKFRNLFKILNNIEFRYDFERDENRDADGHDLRKEYYVNIPSWCSTELKDAFMGHWTTVLEVLIALAMRVDDEYIGDPGEEHPETFFMEMIKNLGLDKFHGNIYAYDKNIVIKVINRWLDRDFSKNGVGSPFPLHYNKTDQRNLEIWDQMQAYVNEKYE